MTSPSTSEASLGPSWDHFVEGLRAFIARRVPAQDAEDVAQDALLRIHKSATTLRDPQRVQGWVYSVARHAIADYYRSHRRIEVADALELESMADPSAAVAEKLATFRGDHSAHEEVLTWLRPIAEGLPSGYREALLMADFEGVTQREVAEKLGLSLPGAKSRIQRARRMLAAELEQCCSVELGADGRVEDFKRNACDC
ncbi:MAG: sigma-70 family RNA polymerase sigma factor [Acidobacteriota bacterium]